MIKRLFILFLLTSCYSVDRNCENFKIGEFEFTYKLNDTIDMSLFTRTLDYEIEKFNNVIDSSSNWFYIYFSKYLCKYNKRPC